jgi:peroxiredoxin Q/BCP
MELTIGQKAPDFNLPDQAEKMHKLSDYAGKWVLLYFYPKDDTPGCTKQACGIRDNYESFTSRGIKVFGVSKDPIKKHVKFVEKYELPFTLLADEEKESIQAYDSWKLKKFMGREYMGTERNSFLIDPEGNIAKIYEKVKPVDHAELILADFDALQA